VVLICILIKEKGIDSLGAVKQDVLVSGTNIKTINSTSLLGSGDISVGAAWGSITGTLSSQTDLQTALNTANDDDHIKIVQALGGDTKYECLGANRFLHSTGVGLTLTDNRQYFIAIYVAKAETITGVQFLMNTQGNFTGDQTNSLALYSYSGGTMTKVAETANDANIWKNAASSFVSVPFSSSYSADVGIYFISILYNSSAQTTAPAIAGIGSTNTAFLTANYTNSAKANSFINTQNSHGATVLMSAVSATTNQPYCALY